MAVLDGDYGVRHLAQIMQHDLTMVAQELGQAAH